MIHKKHKEINQEILTIKVDFYNGLINDFTRLLKTNKTLLSKVSFLNIINTLIEKITIYKEFANKYDLLYSSSYFLLLLSNLIDLKLKVVINEQTKIEIPEEFIKDQKDILINLKEHRLILELIKYFNHNKYDRQLSFDKQADYKFLKPIAQLQPLDLEKLEKVYLKIKKRFELKQPLVKDNVNFIDINDVENHFASFFKTTKEKTFFLKKHLKEHNMITTDHLALSFFVLLFFANDAKIEFVNQLNFNDLKIILHG
ncbi:hypothetical protein [Mycoplasma sp. SG1]|uniref:hypothetical protein n=1 Tax=Mycoplasma sp. SG1 TaxID=2810348 RepID=UPI0020250C6D|nr:hypothetical protein [Mycoplasma sp. SG1]URM52963.1 hypothetical protein JRW51_01295 [Mycoplasma sp. SG1]